MRNFVLGVEDSLVSTVGLLSGIAVADTPRETILLAGLVLIFVEALSMAAGSFLSEASAERYLTKREVVSSTSLVSGTIMFFSYFIAGFVPLAPYIFLPLDSAFWVSISASLAALFILGVGGAKISQTNLLKGGIRMLLIGGIALGVGVGVGMFLGAV